MVSAFIKVCVCFAAAMYAAMAAPENKDDQPKATSNGVIGFLFYAAFIVIGAFCLLNLYVGVIFSEFSKIRLLSTAGSAFLTTKQQVGGPNLATVLLLECVVGITARRQCSET